jgi:hypothetical protein
MGVAIQTLSLLAVRPIERSGIALGYGGIATDCIEEGLRRLISVVPPRYRAQIWFAHSESR